MRVIVTGGRKFADAAAVDRELSRLTPTLIVAGGASGADMLAVDWAFKRKIPFIIINAQWKIHGKAAGPIRNSRMIAEGADLVVAFPGGTGTADCVRKARAAGIEVLEVTS